MVAGQSCIAGSSMWGVAVTALREGRWREGDGAMRDRTLVDRAAAPAAACSQRWAGGVIALLLLITCWGAWVFLIGFRPCVLSYVLWR
jgi:hypothetical protein